MERDIEEILQTQHIVLPSRQMSSR